MYDGTWKGSGEVRDRMKKFVCMCISQTLINGSTSHDDSFNDSRILGFSPFQFLRRNNYRICYKLKLYVYSPKYLHQLNYIFLNQVHK